MNICDISKSLAQLTRSIMPYNICLQKHCGPRLPDRERRIQEPQRGDIYTISMSVYHPLLAAVGATNDAQDCTTLYSENGYKKPRPCVIYETPKTSRSGMYIVCLMASFNKKVWDKLPKLFQDVVIPIPTIRKDTAVGEGRVHHIHTTPDWQSERPQYVLIVPVSCRPGDLGRRWHLSDVQYQSSTRGHRIPFHLDEAIAFNRLDIKIKQWERHWQNTVLCYPDKVRKYTEEVKRERKINPDDYECSTVGRKSRYQSSIRTQTSTAPDLAPIRESGEDPKYRRLVLGSKRSIRSGQPTPIAPLSPVQASFPRHH